MKLPAFFKKIPERAEYVETVQGTGATGLFLTFYASPDVPKTQLFLSSAKTTVSGIAPKAAVQPLAGTVARWASFGFGQCRLSAVSCRGARGSNVASYALTH